MPPFDGGTSVLFGHSSTSLVLPYSTHQVPHLVSPGQGVPEETTFKLRQEQEVGIILVQNEGKGNKGGSGEYSMEA